MNSTVPSSPKDNAHDVIRVLLDMFDMQEKRQRGEWRITDAVARSLIAHAKARAQRFLNQ